MEIVDLTRFLVVSRLQNLQQAANELDTTPSALSKSIKRLETSLGLALFDRIGKSIKLNAQGKQLQPKAAEIVLLAKQTQQQLCPNNKPLTCRVAASAVMQYRWASVISRCLSGSHDCCFNFITEFEMAAKQKLLLGEVELAIVTDAVLASTADPLTALPLGDITMQLAVGHTHPLAQQKQLDPSMLLQHPFATPHVSPFCGQHRGLGCDGWNDRVMPRKVGWIINDYSVLSQLVKSGQAIAYLPDFLIREWQLQQLSIAENPHNYTEQAYLLHHNYAPDWLKQLASAIAL